MNQQIFRLVITSGEPAGIGPDLILKLAQHDHNAELIIIADPELLQHRATRLGLDFQFENFNPELPAKSHTAGRVKIIPTNLQHPVEAGALNKANAHYVLETLRLATQGCLENKFDAMITAPIHKGIINEAGVKFSGHTEFLAELSNSKQVVMMLATPGLRVALATTHLPLRDVAENITPELLEAVLLTLHQELQQKFGLSQPNIYVCGLNPHAGEEGHLGSEDENIVKPVLNKLRSEGMRLHGPMPADTLFIPKYLNNADAVLAMYHDQGLPVLKHMGFGKAVNITLGLPFIRTSVDHGTALELAGTGNCDTGSLEYAIDTALSMASQRQN